MALDLDKLQQRIGHRFADADLAKRALTHRSARREHNERLEFLGDALLGWLMAERAYHAHPQAGEGDLTIMRAAVVNRAVLAEIATQLELGELLELGSGEAKSGGRQRTSILATAMEALIAAVYLDGGLDVCRDFVARHFPPPGAGYAESGVRKDNKTRLQEFLQGKGMALPDYSVVAVDGRGHEQRFRVRCSLAGRGIAGEGGGASRRVAEQEAAGLVLTALGLEPPR